MKTKNMRKKALLSSVAMLLVAVVALSGATYAWFSANSTANLSSIDFTSSKASSLLIAEKDTEPAASEYAAVVTRTWNQALVPCSSANGTSFYAVTNSSAKADGDLQTVEAISQTSSGYLHKTLWFKSDAPADVRLSSLTTTAETLNLSSAMRVALVPAGGTATIYGVAGADTYNGITGTTSYVAGSATFAALYAGTATGVNTTEVTAIEANNTSAAFVSLAAGTAKQVDLYIWLEGNDSACTNNISGGTLSGMSFQFDVA